MSYLTHNNILHPHQSAYSPNKSTETALCKVATDIQLNKHGTLLVLLDMSAAFDTLDLEAIVNRLYDIGIRGNALSLLESYIKNRVSKVKIGSEYSHTYYHTHGVP